MRCRWGRRRVKELLCFQVSLRGRDYSNLLVLHCFKEQLVMDRDVPHSQVIEGFAVGYDKRDQVLGERPVTSPRLSKTEDGVRLGGTRLALCCVLTERRHERVVVLEHSYSLLLLQRPSVLRGGISMVNHRPTQSCGIDVPVFHVDNKTSLHRLEYLTGQ